MTTAEDKFRYHPCPVQQTHKIINRSNKTTLNELTNSITLFQHTFISLTSDILLFWCFVTATPVMVCSGWTEFLPHRICGRHMRVYWDGSSDFHLCISKLESSSTQEKCDFPQETCLTSLDDTHSHIVKCWWLSQPLVSRLCSYQMVCSATDCDVVRKRRQRFVSCLKPKVTGLCLNLNIFCV